MHAMITSMNNLSCQLTSVMGSEKAFKGAFQAASYALVFSKLNLLSIYLIP